MTNPTKRAKMKVQGEKRAKKLRALHRVEQQEKGGKYMLLSIAYCYEVVKDEKTADSFENLLNSYFG